MRYRAARFAAQTFVFALVIILFLLTISGCKNSPTDPNCWVEMAHTEVDTVTAPDGTMTIIAIKYPFGKECK